MTNPLSDFYYTKLGKMIKDADYDLNEKFAAPLLEQEFIKLIRWATSCGSFCVDYSHYEATLKGRRAYKKWVSQQ